MARKGIFKPDPERIHRMCLQFQNGWNDIEWNDRIGITKEQKRSFSSVRHYYVHHRESVKLPKDELMLPVWRCTNGR
jgi:hypothetical protein